MTIQEAAGALMDEIPAETRRRLVREVELVEGVLAVEQARVRRAGADYFADLTLALPRRSTFEHTEELVGIALYRRRCHALAVRTGEAPAPRCGGPTTEGQGQRQQLHRPGCRCRHAY